MHITILLRGLMYIGLVGGVIFAWNTRRKQKARTKNSPATPPVTVQPDDLASLTDPHWQTRLAAVRAAAHKHDPSRIPDLAPLLNDDDPDVREEVVSAMIGFGKQAVPALIETLAAGRMEGREAAARALGQIAHISAVPGLVKALDDESEWVRQPVVEALGRIGGREAVTGLQKALQDPSKDVRAKAESVLQRLGVA